MIRFFPLLVLAPVFAQDAPTEDDFFEIITLPVPEGVVLEVSALALLEDGRPIVGTRRGEAFIVENAYAEDPATVKFLPYTVGLQEPLGFLVEEGWVYFVQRGELSRMRDADGDGSMDEMETVCDDWYVGGNYHEYNFGPRRPKGGDMWITTNRAFGDQPFGRVKWRGFALRITEDGKMVPEACGLRSPAGVQNAPWGDLFYTDNQGEWCGASKLSQIIPGSFHGHPFGIHSCDDPLWRFPHPGDPPNGVKMPEVAKDMPHFQLPAVWFPYDKMGRSPAGFVWDEAGHFGPFKGQVFVTDQYAAEVMRVKLEQIDGHWQGACFPFRRGLQCGAIRCAWGQDGSLLVGMTNRGWGGKGNSPYGLQRVKWTGQVPFEVLEMNAKPDGFELVFTAPANETARDPASYKMESYTYLLHANYGSPEVDRAEPAITGVTLSADGLRARMTVEGLRAGYVHELHMPGVRSRAGVSLLHDAAYYTLIRRPKRD